MRLNQIATLALLWTAPAAAQPSNEVLKWISDSYHPQVIGEQVSTNLSLVGCWIDVIKIKGKDPLTQKTRAVDIKIYHPYANDESAPTVLILPPTGGENILDRGYANSICNNGMRAVLVSGWEHQLDTDLDPKMHDRGALRALTAIRHVIEFLKPSRPGQIGILGTSVGAMSSALALNYEPRLQVGAMIVGAGRFADVIADSDESGARALREARMKAFGYKNIEEYRAALKASIQTEPGQFVSFSGEKKTMLVTADADTTVATQYQLEYVSQLNPETHLALAGNHLEAIKTSFLQHCSAITAFFKRNLTAATLGQVTASK